MVPGVCRERWCRVWVLPRPTHHKQVQGGGVARRLDGSSSGPGTQFHAPPPALARPAGLGGFRQDPALRVSRPVCGSSHPSPLLP